MAGYNQRGTEEGAAEQSLVRGIRDNHGPVGEGVV
jgi:hypothetical protein